MGHPVFNYIKLNWIKFNSIKSEGEDVLVPGAHKVREEDIEGDMELRPPLDGPDYGQVGGDQGGGAAGPGGLWYKFMRD